MTRVSHAIDRFDVSFDDPNLVANAGLLLTATLSDRVTDDDVVSRGNEADGIFNLRDRFGSFAVPPSQ